MTSRTTQDFYGNNLSGHLTEVLLRGTLGKALLTLALCHKYGTEDGEDMVNPWSYFSFSIFRL